MSDRLSLPIFRDLVAGGIRYGANYVVEFEPHSPWYETSLTIAAHAVTSGIRTEYHTFQHIPNEVKAAFTRLGLNLKQLEEQKVLRILDTYSVTTGLSTPEKPSVPRGRVLYETQSFKLADWSLSLARVIKEGAPEEDKRWLHMDDNTSVLNQYNDEKLIIDIWRTGVASNAFYRQFEQLCDGIIDFKSEESSGRKEHHVRVRSLRGQACDSRWRRLQIRDNGQVTLAH